MSIQFQFVIETIRGVFTAIITFMRRKEEPWNMGSFSFAKKLHSFMNKYRHFRWLIFIERSVTKMLKKMFKEWKERFRKEYAEFKFRSEILARRMGTL